MKMAISFSSGIKLPPPTARAIVNNLIPKAKIPSKVSKVVIEIKAEIKMMILKFLDNVM